MNDKYSIQIIRSAENDLEQIYSYIYLHDCPENANYVLNSLHEVVRTLDFMPQRGHVVPELLRAGINCYRQVTFKPYRIIYSIDETKQQVIIEIILDGRRQLETILKDDFDLLLRK